MLERALSFIHVYIFLLSPPTHSYSMDIALLNLANVLHRSQHSADALVPLQVAVSLAPDVNVLHYTLGNVYAVSLCVYVCVCGVFTCVYVSA